MNSILEEDVDPEESGDEHEDSDVPVSGSDSDSDGPEIKIPANLFSPERTKNKEDLLHNKRKNRPRNTKKAYHPKQKRFMKFAQQKYHSPVVTSDSAFAFLSRLIREGASWSTWESYLKAVEDLRKSQKVAGFGQQDNIRKDSDIALMRANLLAGMAKMKREYASSVKWCLSQHVFCYAVSSKHVVQVIP